jgi:hypothetical protein
MDEDLIWGEDFVDRPHCKDFVCVTKSCKTYLNCRDNPEEYAKRVVGVQDSGKSDHRKYAIVVQCPTCSRIQWWHHDEEEAGTIKYFKENPKPNNL